MRGIVKVISLVLIIASVMSCSLISCDRSYDEAEVLASAKELLSRAELLNEVYYGGGINYITTGYIDGNYYEADPLHLAVLGFTTVEELRIMTENTFTLGYSEEIFGTKLSMIEDETGIQEMTRYFQKYDGKDFLDPVCIMVYSRAKRQLTGDIEYDYSTLRVTGVKGQTVYVTVTAAVTNAEGKTMDVDIEINLIEEDNGWRIDNPCYANYSELGDKYGELGG